MVAADALSPTLVPIVVLAATVLVASAGLVVLVARYRGPGPAEVALAYEHAWDRLDFTTLWNLSGDRLRDGRPRAAFVADKHSAYRAESGLAGLVRSVRPEVVEVQGPVARVVTRLELTDGRSVTDEMLLERAGSRWRVISYQLARPRQT